MTRTWYLGTESTRLDALRPGDLIAFDYQPWTFIDLRETDDGKPVIQVERKGKRRHLIVRGERKWSSVPKITDADHYPVCSCGDLKPCRDEDMRRTIEQETRQFDRYTTPGVCPACNEVITTRQKAMSWPNLLLPGTPDVRFHLRWSCRPEAMRYDQRCVTAGHESRFAGSEALPIPRGFGDVTR